MAIPTGAPPGGAGTSSQYPQWGVDQAGKVIKASNASQKQADIDRGYMEWFTSSAAARTWYRQQQEPFLNGKAPALSGLAAIGDFFARLTQANVWVRVGETVLGLVLIAAGIARLTRAVPVATKVAKAAGAVALA